jgi:hypothetical protein
MKSVVSLTIVFIYCIVHVLCDGNRKPPSTHCYDQINDPYIQFAKKTGYRVNQNKEDEEIKIQGSYLYITT